jgi:hypothetical protein
MAMYVLCAIGLAGIFVFFAWCLCATAARADDEMDKIFRRGD